MCGKSRGTADSANKIFAESAVPLLFPRIRLVTAYILLLGMEWFPARSVKSSWWILLLLLLFLTFSALVANPKKKFKKVILVFCLRQSTRVIYGLTRYSYVVFRSKRVDRCVWCWAWGVSGSRRPHIVHVGTIPTGLASDILAWSSTALRLLPGE